MSAYVQSDEFMYWVKAAIALQITKAGITSFAEHEMKKTFLKPFTDDNAHCIRFLMKIVFKNVIKVKREYANKRGSECKWTLRSKCTVCTNTFKLILENNNRRGQKSFNWKCHGDQNISPSIFWWIIAKLYIPSNNEQSTGPKEVDPLSLFQLLSHCKLFEDERDCALEDIKVRIKLMHNSSNTIDKDELAEVFKVMKALLKHKRIEPMSSKALVDIEKIENEQFLCIASKKKHDMIIQALNLKWRALGCDINEDTGIISSTKLNEMFKKIEEEINKEIASVGYDVTIQHLQDRISIYAKERKDKYEEEKSRTKQQEEELDQLRQQLNNSKRDYQTLRERYEGERSKATHKETEETETLRQKLTDSERNCQNLRERDEEEQKQKKKKQRNCVKN